MELHGSTAQQRQQVCRLPQWASGRGTGMKVTPKCQFYWTGTKIFSIIIKDKYKEQIISWQRAFVSDDLTHSTLHRHPRADTTGNTMQPKLEGKLGTSPSIRESRFWWHHEITTWRQPEWTQHSHWDQLQRGSRANQDRSCLVALCNTSRRGLSSYSYCNAYSYYP